MTVLFDHIPAVATTGDAARKRASRASSRNISIPPPADAARRSRCSRNLLRFIRTYLALAFGLPFSPDHIRIIHRLQNTILRGGMWCLAAPRGSGKSALVVAACVWALLYGHRRYLVLLCATHKLSSERLDSITSIIETNDLLLADFPGPCLCIRAVAGAPQRAGALTADGHPTHIRWGRTSRLVMPTLKSEPSSGAAFECLSLDGKIKGLLHTSAAGEMIRPDLVIIDDPVDPEEALSPTQIDKIDHKIQADVTQLGGPGVSTSIVMLCTVVGRDDIACRYLDHKLRPHWRGRTIKALISPPTNLTLWERYNAICADSLDTHGDIRLATDYYRSNRAEMDAGARCYWAARYRPERQEISALQFLMNEYYRLGPEIFGTEYQNEPPSVKDSNVLVLSAYRIETNLTGYHLGVVPPNTLAIVSGWDVNKLGIYWVSIAAHPHRHNSVIAYGVEPIDAPKGAIDPSDAKTYRAMEVAASDALNRLTDKFIAEPYTDEAGAPHPHTLIAIDDGFLTHIVYTHIARPRLPMIPVKGYGTSKHQRTYTIPKGATLSRDGNMYQTEGKYGRYYSINADAMKELVHQGFLLEQGTPGSLAVFTGEHRKVHHTYARHVTAQAQVEIAPGIVRWRPVRGHADDHYLSATYNAIACLSYLEHNIPALAITETTTVTRGFRHRPRLIYQEV